MTTDIRLTYSPDKKVIRLEKLVLGDDEAWELVGTMRLQYFLERIEAMVETPDTRCLYLGIV